MSSKCPRLSIRRAPVNGKLGFVAESEDGDWLGTLAVREDPASKSLVVSTIDVNKKHRKCHIGTKLYEAAARYACSRNLPMRSDELLSRCSYGFWRKQQQKDRAKCLSECPQERYDEAGINDECGATIFCRGNCKQFEIADPCRHKDLGRSKRSR